MRNRIYTLSGCTIEVPKGGRTATAKRHVDGTSVKFQTVAGGATAEVQAQRWALNAANQIDDATELDEASDGQ